MEFTILSAIDFIFLVIAWVFCCYVFGRSLIQSCRFFGNDVLSCMTISSYAILLVYSVTSPWLLIYLPFTEAINILVLFTGIGVFITQECKFQKTLNDK